MGNLKWADVAHYYQYVAHEVFVSHGGNEPIRRMLEEGENLAQYYRRRDLVDGKFVATPILRHLDDMTRDEALEIYQSVGHLWEQNSVSDFYNLPMDWHIRNRIRREFPEWHAMEWQYLISRGFDMFRLIESGQAIRKES
jgi:hypothetical protein